MNRLRDTRSRTTRITIAAVLAVTGIGAATWAGGGAASAATGKPLVSSASRRCLDVVGNSPTVGTGIQIWDCNSQSNQAWVFTSAGELRTFDNSRCLDAANAGTARGTKLISWTCSGSANQKFRLNSNGSITGTQSGLCVDVATGATAAGTPIQLWTCTGGGNQKWSTTGGTTTPPPVTTPPVTTPPVTTPPATGGCGAAPVDPNATTAARKLLCYIYSQYGNHIISGQQESTWVAGPDYEMNYIHNISGKYPAIRGQDMGDSPTFGARGLAWWKSGGIPMVSYHMGSPSQGADGWAAAMLNANISSALTAGSANNRTLNARLNNWANQLKVIQNGGGAVIFRPWHEASGTWFWWSKEGAGQYNRLWVYTYNFMRNAGVHNLVYLHPFNGSPNGAWYPGKRYVDVGGADTYVSNHGPLTSLFNSTKSVYGGSIPIALHENGPIPDPAQLKSAGAHWVLFNTWHTTWITNTGVNPTSTIKAAYTSAYVVTRDEVPNLR